MELTFLGLGGAFNTALGNNMAIWKDNDKLLLIDCGENCLNQLQKIKAFDGVKQIYVAITHNHADHVAGLGNLISYAKLVLNIPFTIIQNTPSHAISIKAILTLMGVDKKYYNFVSYCNFNMNGLKITPMPTEHAKTLECFGFWFTDKNGKYYYTGDTTDFELIQRLCAEKEIKTIYTEVTDAPNVPHIQYEKLKELDKSKLRLMHFSSMDNLHKKAQDEGFIIAKNIVL